MGIGFEEGVLEDVFGVLVVLGDVFGEAENFAIVTTDESGEGGIVALAREVNERRFVENVRPVGGFHSCGFMIAAGARVRNCGGLGQSSHMLL